MAIRFWNDDESIFDATGKIDTAYRPDPTGALALETLASATRGRVFEERDLGEAASYLRGVLGTGPTRPVELRQRNDLLLGPYLAVLALAPLALLVARRERVGRSLVVAIRGLL
jgi:hypothetical protein